MSLRIPRDPHDFRGFHWNLFQTPNCVRGCFTSTTFVINQRLTDHSRVLQVVVPLAMVPNSGLGPLWKGPRLTVSPCTKSNSFDGSRALCWVLIKWADMATQVQLTPPPTHTHTYIYIYKITVTKTIISIIHISTQNTNKLINQPIEHFKLSFSYSFEQLCP